MKLEFGDKEGIQEARKKIKKIKIERRKVLYFRYLSKCHNVFVLRTCEKEQPINQKEGVTLIEICSECKTEYLVNKIAIY